MSLKETKKLATNRYELEITIDAQKFGEAIKKAYGELLFTLAGLQQSLHINAEEALNLATNAFIENIEQAE